jgi:hypothetical protein
MSPLEPPEKSLVSLKQCEECTGCGVIKGRIGVLELEGTFGDHPVHPLILVCSHSGKTRAAFISWGRVVQRER